MDIGLPWQEAAKRDSVWDYSIKVIIDKIPDERTRNIKGKKFPDANRLLAPFAVADQKIVYAPSWVKNYFELYEFEWIVFHEVGHIIYNHKYKNPLDEDYIADEYAVRLQDRIGFGICVLKKFSNIKMPRTLSKEQIIKVGNGEIQKRIDILKRLGLPW